jgi:dihydropteroate synthase-like protein
LFDLPEYFGIGKRRVADLSTYWIDIIAEINHATRHSLHDVLAQARAMAAAGANLIDVGCVPGESSSRVAEIVAALRAENLRVSIDSFDQREVEHAVAAGAELILSCNHANYDWVTRLGVEVVAIPDTPQDMASLDRLIARLTADGIPFRADPIVEPIGMGFTDSLARYIDCRRKHPDIALMMGIGNVTELTEVDSAGANMLLAAFCEELGIQSVLTTQVINWCRTAVAEFDRARRLVHHAVSHRTVPKHLDGSLLLLRDARLRGLSPEQLADIAKSISDPNFRIHVAGGELHLMNRDGYWTGPDAFRLFEQALRAGSRESTLSAEHAFYLGYEMARAELALHLGKNYAQDEPLKFGVLGELKASSSAAVHRDD